MIIHARQRDVNRNRADSHGFLKIQMGDTPSVYTDFTERTEFFRHFTEETVLSVGSVYKKQILSSDNEKTIIRTPALHEPSGVRRCGQG